MIKSHVFVDTMVFVHCVPLDQIDWCAMMQSDSVEIVVPRITFTELEKHKNDYHNSRLRNRATQAISLLKRHCGTNVPLRENVSVSFLQAYPDIDWTPLGLNRNSNDDVLVASVLAWKRSHPESRVSLVSEDSGVQLTARHLEIHTTELDYKYRLPAQLDEDEKEIKRLQRELQKLQNALPRLQVGFLDCEDVTSIQNTTEFILDLREVGELRAIEEKITKAITGLPEIQKPQNEDRPEIDSKMGVLERLRLQIGGSISDAEYERYSLERQRFLKEVEIYRENASRYFGMFRRSFMFSISIKNCGSAPAEDVDVHLHFPDGFDLYELEKYPKKPSMPRPPVKPRSGRQLMEDQVRFSMQPLMPLMPRIHDPLVFSSFSMKRTNSYDIVQSFPRIKQGQHETLPELALAFDTDDSIKSFHCTYKITVANLPEPLEGELHFAIEIGQHEK